MPKAAFTRVRDEEKRLPPIASALENESVRPWRLLEGLVCASLPNGFGVNPGTVQRISRPFDGASVAVA
jgi:hypothetical protein